MLKRTLKLLLTFFIAVFSFSLKAQNQDNVTETGFSFDNNRRSIRIQGKETHNLMIIPMVINDSPRLNFILDTGVNTTILTEPILAELFNFEIEKPIYVLGIGNEGIVEAGLAKNLNFKLRGITGHNMDMIILPEGILSFNELFGFPVHGIIGYDLFKEFAVKVNYNFESVRIYRKPNYRTWKKSNVVDLNIKNNKPYVPVVLNSTQTEKADTVELLLDLGATNALFLNRGFKNLVDKTIPSFLGKGISGVLMGDMGRLDHIIIDDLVIDEPLVAFPQEEFLNQANLSFSWNGILGGDVLKRFHLIIDYPSEKMVMRKNYRFDRPFKTNLSGIEIIAKGIGLNEFIVNHVRENSPADEAGIESGDRIIRINGQETMRYSLDQVVGMLSQSPGKKIEMRILREKDMLTRRFRLREDL